jgi:hypothetical protein
MKLRVMKVERALPACALKYVDWLKITWVKERGENK